MVPPSQRTPYSFTQHATEYRSLVTQRGTPLTPPHFLLCPFPSPAPTHNHAGSLSSQKSPLGLLATLGPSATAAELGVLPTPILPHIQQRKVERAPWNVSFFPYTAFLPKHSCEAFLMNKILHFITQVIQVRWTKGACWGLARD